MYLYHCQRIHTDIFMASRKPTSPLSVNSPLQCSFSAKTNCNDINYFIGHCQYSLRPCWQCPNTGTFAFMLQKPFIKPVYIFVETVVLLSYKLISNRKGGCFNQILCQFNHWVYISKPYNVKLTKAFNCEFGTCDSYI